MGFDFNVEPARLYSIWPETPFPVEVSIYGTCSNACFYCFANLNRVAAERKPETHAKNPVEKLISGLERRMGDAKDPIGFFLREKYPVCFSNTTDPFMREEKTYRCTEGFLKWAKVRGVPLWIQTKGNVLFEDFDRYAPLIIPGKDAVYITLTTLDSETSKRIEPGAPSPLERLELVRKLSERGVPVVVGCNPYLAEWAGSPEIFCDTVKGVGARGVWLEQLHFSDAQGDHVPPGFREYVSKANIQPMYLIGELKQWYRATASRGLDFYPTPQWDSYFGHRAVHPECADPEWFGEKSKTFRYAFEILSTITRESYGGPVYPPDMDGGPRKGTGLLISWSWIEQKLVDSGCPNPLLRVDPFWGPFNAKQTGDHRLWKRTLGKEAHLYEILRYFYNNPWTNSSFLWYSPLAQMLMDYDNDVVVAGRGGNAMMVFNPSIRHHGDRFLDLREFDRREKEFKKMYHEGGCGSCRLEVEDADSALSAG